MFCAGRYSGSGLPSQLAYGFPRTVQLGAALANASIGGTANAAWYYRVDEGGMISKIRIRVGTQSGNICVGVYRSSGVGLSAVPAARAATSGTVACPAPGDADVDLTAAVYVNPGDFLALQADNTTATFTAAGGGVVGGTTTLMAGRAYRQTVGSMPLPDTAASLAAQDTRTFVLIGVA